MMADNYKILAQETAASTEIQTSQPQAKAVYTVPAGVQTSISSVSVTNVSSSNATYKLGAVKAENVASENVTFDLELQPAYTEEVSNSEYSAIFSGTSTASSDQYFKTTTDFINYDPTYRPYSNGSYDLSARTPDNWSAVGEFSVIVSQARSVLHYWLSTNSGKTYTYYYSPGNYVIADIVWSNGLFILLTTNGYIYTSSSGAGTDWTLRFTPGTNPIPYRLLKVRASTFDYVFATGGNAYLTYSSNGTSWGTTYLGYAASGYPFYPSDITYANGYWYLLDGYYDGALYRAGSIGGARTKITSLSPNPYSYYQSREYRVLANTPDQTAVVAISSGRVAVSRDNGSTWTKILEPTPATGNLLPGYYNLYTSSRYLYAYSYNYIYLAVSKDNGYTLNTIPLDRSITTGTLYVEEKDSTIVEHPAVVEHVSLETISDKSTIIPNRIIEPKAVDEIVGGIVLSEGDQIRVYSDSEDVLVHVYGVELS